MVSRVSCVKMEAKYSLKAFAMSMLFSAYDLLFPSPSFNCLDTFPGICETFDFNLKNDQNRFGLCSQEVQIELKYCLRLSRNMRLIFARRSRNLFFTYSLGELERSIFLLNEFFFLMLCYEELNCSPKEGDDHFADFWW